MVCREMLPYTQAGRVKSAPLGQLQHCPPGEPAKEKPALQYPASLHQTLNPNGKAQGRGAADTDYV
jgi:hypothetical protein